MSRGRCPARCNASHCFAFCAEIAFCCRKGDRGPSRAAMAFLRPVKAAPRLREALRAAFPAPRAHRPASQPRPRLPARASHGALSPRHLFCFFSQLNEKVHVHCLFFFAFLSLFFVFVSMKFQNTAISPAERCREKSSIQAVGGGKRKENCQRKKKPDLFQGVIVKIK